MAQTQQTQQQTGEVEATNERGIKLGGRWLNYSQFHTVPHPEVGQVVRVTIQRDRFITRLEVLDGAGRDAAEGAVALSGDELDGLTPPAEPDDDDPAPWGYGSTGSPAAASGSARRLTPAPQAGKAPAPSATGAGRATLKAAALTAAAHFLSGKPDSTEDAVYETAYRFLAWLQDEGD